MIEADRVLRPLEEAEPAIEQLETYESPAVLLEALRATWHAVERTLRMLLRSDPTATDAVRLSAMSPADMTLDGVLTELRRRDRISLPLAGQVHELGQAVRRAEAGGVHAADADLGLDVARELRRVVHELADRPVRASAHAAVVTEALGDDVHPVPAVPRVMSGSLVLGAIVGVVLIAAVLAVLLLGRTSDMEKGIEAFREERYALAEQHFRAALGRNDDNVTARLYLARILRAQARNQEVAELLKGAVRLAPRDPAVRRELGHLFLDLQQPAMAIEHFQLAVEEQPDEDLNWVGLIEALYRANDPSADEWLARAPPSVQAMIRTGRR